MAVGRVIVVREKGVPVGGGVDLRRGDGDVVLAVGGDVYGIGEPLAGLEVVDRIAAAARLGGGDDVNVLGGAELAVAEVALGEIVISDAFATLIEVARLERGGPPRRAAPKRGGGGGGRGSRGAR